jgi:hypothetical protein
VNTLLTAAVQYARSGWRVFPCAPFGKTPITSAGVKDATTDRERIEQWWKKTRNANVAIACGKGLGFVLDVDGQEGVDSLASLTSKHGKLPDTMTSKTGGGGYHTFLASDDPRIRNKVKVLPGLDIRCDGGYVIAPPSMHKSGEPYRWIKGRGPGDIGIAKAPLWLLDVVFADIGQSKSAVTYGTTDQDRINRALAFIDCEDHDDWIQVGMALHAWAHDQGGPGRRLWDVWACKSAKFSDRVQEKRWRSFKAGAGLTLSSLFALAKRRGFNPSADSDRPAGRPMGPPKDEPKQCAPKREEKPRIVISTDICSVVDEAESALLESEDIYQRAGAIVQIHRDVTMMGDDLRISPIKNNALTERMSRSADWIRTKEKDGIPEERPAMPPPWVAKTLSERARWRFRPLRGVVECPTMRDDGSVISAPGYDDASGLYFESSCKFADPIVRPTREHARRALDVLSKLISDFPFAAACHKSAIIAAIMTAVVRPSIKGPTPLFLISSSTPGSGKTLLADIVSIIATGRGVARMTACDSEDDDRKRITSIAIAGDRVVCIDNVTKPLGNGTLDAAITSDHLSPWRDRVLGSSSVVSMPISCVWLATGNNVTIKGDLARRTVPVSLAPKCERPEERTDFVCNDLRSYVLRNRGVLAIAALTIAQAYAENGSVAVPIPSMGGFDRWSTVVRCALVWTGAVDPNIGRTSMRAEVDVDLLQWGAVLEALRAVFEARPFTSSQIEDELLLGTQPGFDKNERRILLRESLADIGVLKGQSVSAKLLGYLIRKYKSRIVDGLYLEQGPKGRLGRLWQIVSLNEPATLEEAVAVTPSVAEEDIFDV